MLADSRGKLLEVDAALIEAADPGELQRDAEVVSDTVASSLRSF